MSRIPGADAHQRTDLRDRLFNKDFDASKVIGTLVSRNEGLPQLEEVRRRLHDSRDNANLELRKNAFKYYNAIIGAAKDMQQLEKNLVELKSSLSEEKKIIDAATESSDDLIPKRGAGDRRSALAQQNVDVSSSIVHYKADRDQENHDASTLPLWFKEAAVDVEDHYEMRRFGLALDLLMETKKYLKSIADPELRSAADGYTKAVKDAEEDLMEKILHALKGAMDCPFGVDKNICQQYIGYLKTLNRSYDASIAFLDNRSRSIHLSVSSVKIEGNISVYFKLRTQAFFTQLSRTVQDFDDLGFQGPECKSALTGWIRFHITTFVSQHSDSVFSAKLGTTSAGDCIKSLREASKMMTTAGMDVDALLDSLLENEAVRFLNAQVERFAESSPLAQENKVQPVTFDSKDALASYLDQFASSGHGIAVPYVDGLRLNIAPQYVDFAGQFVQLVSDIVIISPVFMDVSVEAWMKRVLDPATKSLQTFATKTADSKVNVAALSGTVEFFIRNVIPSAEEVYRDRFNKSSQPLATEKALLVKLHGTLKSKSKPLTYL